MLHKLYPEGDPKKVVSLCDKCYAEVTSSGEPVIIKKVPYGYCNCCGKNCGSQTVMHH